MPYKKTKWDDEGVIQFSKDEWQKIFDENSNSLKKIFTLTLSEKS